jgi:hypothetical protein
MEENMKTVLIILGLAILLVGCGTIKETTTTETIGQTIPATIIHDTISIPVELPLTDEKTDSIGRAYLEKYCKGEVNVDQNGLKASLKFWMSTAKSKDQLLNEKEKSIIQLGYEIENKEREIETIKTTTETKSTPGNLWILLHCWQFLIPTGIIFFILGMVFHARTELGKRIIS